MKKQDINTTALNSEKLKGLISEKQLGWNLIVLEKVDSTSQQIKLLAQQGAKSGTIIVAEQQTNGKGRLGRQWCSPFGTGLWFSILLRPQILPEKIAGITLATGLAVCNAIRQYTNLNAQIKWPNDVIIGNKKVCGILTEMVSQSNKIEYVVVGVGINVNTLNFDDEISCKATSLAKELGKNINREDFFAHVLDKIQEEINKYLSSPDSSISTDYIQLCATLGRQVVVNRGNNTITGTAVAIANNGDLVVQTEDGKAVLINSGEVTVQGIY